MGDRAYSAGNKDNTVLHPLYQIQVIDHPTLNGIDLS